jgi:hypothetical protein
MISWTSKLTWTIVSCRGMCWVFYIVVTDRKIHVASYYHSQSLLISNARSTVFATDSQVQNEV